MKQTLIFALLLLCAKLTFGATFTSTSSGSWNDTSTWLEAGTPNQHDDVIIKSGHIVTLSGSWYKHKGSITIDAGAELIADVGNSSKGFIFDGDDFHVFGKLTMPFPAKDFEITGFSFFWAHNNAEIFVSDDFKISGKTTNVIEDICLEVDDDFHLKGKHATICGGGNISIGSSLADNTLSLESGASVDQFCTGTDVYRSAIGGSCAAIVAAGTGNEEPLAIEDETTTTVNTPISIDVLDLNIPDSDPEEDALLIICVGTNFTHNEMTSHGGAANYNDNGTPADPSDDFVDYTPPTDFTGVDTFIYVITDEKGGFSYAYGIVTTNAPLPVELIDFSANQNECTIELEWATALELNNDYFEVERSEEGILFETIGWVEGVGTSTSINDYMFVDENPLSSNYYRLKQVDRDGKTEYSGIIFVEQACQKTNKRISAINVFPNPVSGAQVGLEFNASLAEKGSLIVADAMGRIVAQQSLSIESGLNSIQLDVNQFASGTYVINVGDQSSRFVKIHD